MPERQSESGSKSTIRVRLVLCEATRQMVASHSAIKVLALFSHADTRFVAGMRRAGAVGYVLKRHAFAELASATHTVLTGQRYLSPHILSIDI